LGGFGLIQQMIATQRENLGRLGKGKLKGFDNKKPHLNLDSTLLNKPISDEKLEEIKINAIKNQKKTRFIQLVKLFLQLFAILFIVILLVRMFGRY